MVHVMTSAITVRALKIIQGEKTEVFSFFLSGIDILKIADISRIHRDEANQLKGFQRKQIQSHVKGIVNYLDSGPVLFPNALILAFQSSLEFKQSRGPSPDGAVSGSLLIPIFPSDKRAAWIVDGQQRAFALSKTKNTDIMVPIVAFVAPEITVQREQFILVNKAKPLPRRLINELLPEISSELPADLRPSKIPSELCNTLNNDPKSPFFRLIKRVSSEAENPKAVITDTALINMMKHSINNYGSLALFKTSGSGQSDIESMYKIICIFWSAVKNTFPEAWGKKPIESRLMHSAGIQAMGVLMDRVMPRIHKTDNLQAEAEEILRKIEPYCCWTEGTWEGLNMKWNDIQNLPKHIKALAELLVQLDFAVNQENG